MPFLPSERTCQIVNRIVNAARLEDLLDLLVEEISALNAADGYLVNMLASSGESLTCLKLRYPDEFRKLEKSYLGYKFPLNDGQLNARAMAAREIMRVNEANASSEEANILRHWKIQEMTAVPLCPPGVQEASPVGVLLLLKQEGAISEESLLKVQELASLFHASLSHWLHYSHLEELHDQATAAVVENKRLLQFLSELNSLTSVDKIYELFAAELFRQLPFDLAAFSMVENGILQPRQVIASKPEYESVRREWERYLLQNPYSLDPASSSGAAYVLARNERMIIPDVDDIRHFPMPVHDRKSLAIVRSARTILTSPIRHREKPIGTFLAFSLEKPVNLSRADQDLLDYLASFLGAAITNSRLYETSQAQVLEIRHLNEMLEEKVEALAAQASTDQLTGLLNFRAFEQELHKRLYEASRQGGKDSLALALIDIDHFKNFNDSFGHAAGNDILAGVAHEIGQHVRQADQACRYGGEEFVLILPRCDLDGARLLAERIRSGIENCRFGTCAGARSITLSIGCTVYRAGDDQHTLFSRADKALYKAKESGRNRVCAI